MIKCTIAIPVYNREDFIRRAIDSALAQDTPDLEILVVDNFSTDRTWEMLHMYEDSRLRLVRNESNIGLIGNFNRCLSLAQGEYVKFLCSDDRLTPYCLNRKIEIMDANPNVVLLTTRGRLVDNKGKFRGVFAGHFPEGIYPGEQAVFSWLWFYSHYGYNPFNYHPGILLRCQTARDVGGFDSRMNVGGDIDLFLLMLERGDLVVLEDIDCEITVHAGQESCFLLENGGLIQDLISLNHRYKTLLQKRNSYSRVMQQTYAIAMSQAIKFLFTGRVQTGRIYWELARSSRSGAIGILIALIRLIGLRVLLKLSGKGITRLPPSLLLKTHCML